MRKHDTFPSPNDPPCPACSNCELNVRNVCTYRGFGNNPYPADYKGRPITWDPKITHCRQHRYRNGGAR